MSLMKPFIEEKDVEHSIYEVPLMLQRERLDDLVCRMLISPRRRPICLIGRTSSAN
jgi:CTP synthase (UTP-ammonia lyase)